MIRTVLRWLLAIFYGLAGVIHLVRPEPFLRIMPDAVPFPYEVVLLTGVAELAGAFAIAQPWSPKLRRAGGAALAIYALCVWPANVNHMLLDLRGAMEGPGLAYHLPRLVIGQPLLIWLALWTSGCIGARTGGTTRAPFRRNPE